MQGLKGVIVVATILAIAALGACRKDIQEEPLKLGASDVAVTIVR
jgi:hypothetical protein